jgi:UDP-N-acetylmuramoyl-tripeptide--D-alanyl-D-alanine ligase
MTDLQRLYQIFLSSTGISTDTRQISPGSVFFALRGPKFNANEYADDALRKGAAFAVVDEKEFVKNEKFILVDDGLQSLQQLASHHRNQLKIPLIGLTGSNGKTTSKELLSAVLRKKFKTFATKGNLNNHIGVPLSVLSIDSSYEIAVIEMGANHVGEIKALAAIANPTHGFITNIGKAHIGTFGGYENIVRGKSELFDHLIRHHGQVFINSLNPVLMNMASRFASPWFYPQPGNYYHAEFISADPYIRLKAENGAVVQTQLLGAYNFENIAAALCIGKFFGVDAARANDAIATYVPENMRSQILKKESNTIILDAYNANPSSMSAAIDNLAAMKASDKVLILGDMFELEEDADKEHRALGRLIRERGFQRVYLVGSLVKSALTELPVAKHFETKALLGEELKKNPITGATILIKASRGIGLESIVDLL